MDYFAPNLPEEEIRKISSLGLAHLGDAVYELMVRSWLCAIGRATAKGLHAATIRYVSAPAQARAAAACLPHLSEEEEAVYRRGRNTKSVPGRRSASHEEYHAATGLEALFGYLYLKDRRERLHELFEICIRSIDAAQDGA
ncbi:MAG TPA: ribonuclease III [Papillibacter sp.]|jgi:ribonuclease-3 family protein|nr:ribonuclease III [Papillibacter sp.]